MLRENHIIGGGLGDRHQQIVDPSTGLGQVVTTNYTLDLAAGLTQVLDDGTNAYLYGNGRIAQAGSTTEYFLGDALGSVRQLADPAGAVTLTQSYAPYGEVTQSIGTSQTSYAFTGENLDANGLTFLRARYYAPQNGRFISRDTWAGEHNRPLSLNRWNYVEGNPVNLVDPSGNSPQVACSNITFPGLKGLCEQANGRDDDQNTINARRKFFSRLATLSIGYHGIGGEGYFWAGAMLAYFLDGSINSVDITLPPNSSFPDDPGIRRATKNKWDAKFSDEPQEITPLLYKFLQEHMVPSLSCSSAFSAQGDVFIRSIDTWSGKHAPRPHDKGWWGAFGHVEPNANYSNISAVKVSDEYHIQVDVTYTIKDNYGWYEGKSTPFGPPVASPAIWIPHEWELSLVDDGAVMFDFTVTWHEKLSLSLDDDFYYFRVNDGKHVLQLLQ